MHIATVRHAHSRLVLLASDHGRAGLCDGVVRVRGTVGAVCPAEPRNRVGGCCGIGIDDGCNEGWERELGEVD